MRYWKRASNCEKNPKKNKRIYKYRNIRMLSNPKILNHLLLFLSIGLFVYWIIGLFHLQSAYALKMSNSSYIINMAISIPLPGINQMVVTSSLTLVDNLGLGFIQAQIIK